MQAIRTWWGQRFMQALERFTDSGRLARGRSYASSNRIKSWQLKDGVMFAKIRGNTNPYYGVYQEPTYETAISLKIIGNDDWESLIRQLGSRASFVSRLLLNEMPDNIETPFEALDLHLLPHNAKDFKTRCSCPDYENPCKHVAGLCYFLASQLDQDPFLLFELRGLSPHELLKKLKQTPLGKALAQVREQEQVSAFTPVESYFTRPIALDQPVACDYKAFWECHKRLPEDRVNPATSHFIPALLIKKGGDFPDFWKQSMPFPVAMESAYEAIRKKSKAW
jgi:uncharacterized Zn finger protein